MSQFEYFGGDDYVPASRLAEQLFANQSNVNRIVAKLQGAELIEYKPYVGVRLTACGRKEALKLLHKQSIIESFLVDVMNFAWDEVYEEAQQIRHNIKDSVLARMWELAGEPSFSPFGEPISTEHLVLNNEEVLANAEIEHDYHVSRVLTRQSDRLKYLAALQLQPGTRLQLLHKAPFNGPLQLQLGREFRIIGHALAKMLTVTPIS